MRFRRDGCSFATAVRTWYGSLKKSSQIALIVVVLHFSAIVWMSIDHFLSPSLQIHRPIVVRTLHPIAPITVTQSRNIAQSTPASSHQVVSIKTPRPSVKKPAPISKSISVRSKRPPKKEPEIHEEEPISFAAPITKKRTEIVLPSIIETKCICSSAPQAENIVTLPGASNYHASLIAVLQSSLQLPEIGEVRAHIVLSNPGQLASIQIIDAKSQKNADWLKSQLPLLELPYFSDYGIVDAVLEFTVTFRNVESN
jgi:hypothetical protein